MSQLKGSGGKPKAPPSPVNTPDNLRSADTVEVILGVSEGPIKGLTNGHKSFYVGDTVLQRQDGEYNFKDFDLKLYPGDANPEMLKYRLGGESSNNQVGVSLAYGIPVTRQTQHGNIDAIDIRLVVSALYKQVQEGKNPGVFDHTFNFAIRFKPVSASTWGDWYDAGNIMSPTNPHVSEWDSSWSPESYQDSEGRWFDPTAPKQWFEGTWLQSVLWYRDQLANQPGGPPPYGSLTIRGKTTSTYVKEFRIPVQRIPEPYQIQIQRLTPDSSLGGDPQYIAEVAWESFQTVDTTPKFYPNTAITQIVAKSTDQFSSIPSMWGVYDGLIVRVPSNYNPYTNTYSGTWDGTWKNEWTNNPVWLLYEAIHNTTWGWSRYTTVKWSKYQAYDLAQVCDHILPNGKPRYTFNAYITDPMDGREFCRYLAGSFNSVIVDDQNGNVQVLMDKDDPAVAIIGPESVVGNIEYSYTDINTRFNDMTVVFANPEIDYNEDRRRLHNQDHMDQHGRIPFDFVAVGCTDENEAVRKASRRMVSAQTETEMATFRTTRIASYWNPYDIILITDPIKGYGYSGRFKSFDGATVTLRDAIYLEPGAEYGIDIQGLNGIVTRGIVFSEGGWTHTLTLNAPLDPATVDSKAQFSLKEGGGGYGLPKPYRILNITETDGDPDNYQVMAIEVNRLKFAAEDNAEIVGEPIYSFPKNKEPARPTNLVVRNLTHPAPDGTIIYEARVDFTPPSDPYVYQYLLRYKQTQEIVYRRDDPNGSSWPEGEEFRLVPLTTSSEYTVINLDSTGTNVSLPNEGTWVFEVSVKNMWEQQSPWLPSNPTLIMKQDNIEGGGIHNIVGGVGQVTLSIVYPFGRRDIRYAVVYGAQATETEPGVWSEPSQSSAEEIGKIDSTTFVHTGLNGIQRWYYWIRFEDHIGNLGPMLGGAYATTKKMDGQDIDDGTIGKEKFTDATWNAIADLVAEGGDIDQKIADAEERMQTAIGAAEGRLNATIGALELEDIDGFYQFNLTIRSDLDGKATTTRVDGIQDSVGNLSGRVVNMEQIVLDLPNEYASVSSLNSLSSEVIGARGGSANLAGRFLAERQITNDGLAGKASASDVYNLSNSITAANLRIDGTVNRLTTIELDITGKANVSDFNSLSATVQSQGNTIGGMITRLDEIDLDIDGKASVSSVETLTLDLGAEKAKISSLQTITADQNGKINSTAGIVNDVNGYATGWSSVNNGTSSAFKIRADKFEVGNSSGSAERTEYSNGHWRAYDSANRLRVAWGVNLP